MTKRAKVKKSNTKSQRSSTISSGTRRSSSNRKSKGIEMPDLVSVMSKFLERIDVLEKKTDLVLSQLQAVASAARAPSQTFQHSGASHHSEKVNQGQPPVHREKVRYEAVCADCFKNCRVPFQPKAGRPVYCPECFAIRKAGHVPKDPTAGVKIPNFPKILTPAPVETKKKASSKKKKQKPAKKTKKK